MKTALVLGAGGFIGSHLVKRLKREGFWVRAVDLKYPEYSNTHADEFILGDLRDPMVVSRVVFAPKQKRLGSDRNSFDELYQLAADMGGAGYIFSGEHDSEVMHNSALINLNVAYDACVKGVKKIFFSSSACIYPASNQTDPNNPNCKESSAYPANPDSEYGWEKLFSERFYSTLRRNKLIDIRVARFHNIFGTEGSWNNGKEKAPAAICRKIAEVPDGGTIEIWGDGNQTRSFLYIDECLEGVRRLMDAPNPLDPINIGSDEMVSINKLVAVVAEIAGKRISVKHIQGPQGVRGRCSDNNMIKELLGWQPQYQLKDGLVLTYNWINKQVNGN
jgi:nucleoside-diphosphate-sugar epimerase